MIIHHSFASFQTETNGYTENRRYSIEELERNYAMNDKKIFREIVVHHAFASFAACAILLLSLLCSSCVSVPDTANDACIAHVVHATLSSHTGENKDYLAKPLVDDDGIPLPAASRTIQPPTLLTEEDTSETSADEFLYHTAPGDVITVAFFRKPSGGPAKTNEEYRLDSMDVITINADLEGGFTYDVTVRPDGRISFFQVEDLDVRGKTIAETRAILAEAFKDVAPEAAISVLLKRGTVMLNEFLESLRTESDGTTRTLRIRQDGYISFPLLGDIYVAGKTVPEISQEVEALYNLVFVSGVSVSINLLSSFQGNVIVLGEVRRPGVYPVHDKINPVHALALAGGVMESGSEEKAILVRPSSNGRYHHWKLDLKTAWKKNNSQEILMEPRDILIFPRTAIADVDLFVEQYIRRLLPIPVSGSVSGSYDLNQ